MNYSTLKNDFASLNTPDMTAAVATLAARTTSVFVDVPTSAVREVLLLSGEYLAIEDLAAHVLTSSDTSATVAAVKAARICIRTLQDNNVLPTSDASKWAEIEPLLSALVTAGVLSPTSAAKVAALRTSAVPVYPDLNVGHIQTALARG